MRGLPRPDLILGFPDRGSRSLAIWDRKPLPRGNGLGHSLRTAAPDRSDPKTPAVWDRKARTAASDRTRGMWGIAIITAGASQTNEKQARKRLQTRSRMPSRGGFCAVFRADSESGDENGAGAGAAAAAAAARTARGGASGPARMVRDRTRSGPGPLRSGKPKLK